MLYCAWCIFGFLFVSTGLALKCILVEEYSLIALLQKFELPPINLWLKYLHFCLWISNFTNIYLNTKFSFKSNSKKRNRISRLHVFLLLEVPFHQYHSSWLLYAMNRKTFDCIIDQKSHVFVTFLTFIYWFQTVKKLMKNKQISSFLTSKINSHLFQNLCMFWITVFLYCFLIYF